MVDQENLPEDAAASTLRIRGGIETDEWNGLSAVSYTHLRAHETVLDIVCRLLLAKTKNRPTHDYLMGGGTAQQHMHQKMSVKNEQPH